MQISLLTQSQCCQSEAGIRHTFHAKLKPLVNPQCPLPHRHDSSAGPPHCPTRVTALAPVLPSSSSPMYVPCCAPVLLPVPVPSGADAPMEVAPPQEGAGRQTLERSSVSASALLLHHPCSTDPPGVGASPPPGAGERRSPNECMGRARMRDETGWVGSVVNQCSDSQGREALALPGRVGQE